MFFKPVLLARSRSTAISFSSGESQRLELSATKLDFKTDRTVDLRSNRALCQKKVHNQSPRRGESTHNDELIPPRFQRTIMNISNAICKQPAKEFAKPKKVDQYPIRIGCSSTLYHIAVSRRYAGVEHASSIPRMNRGLQELRRSCIRRGPCIFLPR